MTREEFTDRVTEIADAWRNEDRNVDVPAAIDELYDVIVAAECELAATVRHKGYMAGYNSASLRYISSEDLFEKLAR